MPMVVSAHFPPLMHAMDEPLPRWHTMRLTSAAGLPMAEAVASATYVYDVLWKP